MIIMMKTLKKILEKNYGKMMDLLEDDNDRNHPLNCIMESDYYSDQG